MRPLAIVTFFLAALAIAVPAEDNTEGTVETLDESRCIRDRYEACLNVCFFIFNLLDTMRRIPLISSGRDAVARGGTVAPVKR